ncbi:hypothetical protein OFD71_41060, partial [Escherichia coli]|nr:hypothetical protein [Escherichia coli]
TASRRTRPSQKNSPGPSAPEPVDRVLDPFDPPDPLDPAEVPEPLVDDAPPVVGPFVDAGGGDATTTGTVSFSSRA